MALKLGFVCKDDMLEDIVRKAKEGDLSTSIDSSFHPSHITECPRRLIYRSTGKDVDNGRKESVFAFCRGESFKHKWVSLLKKSKLIRVLYEDIVAADCNYNLYSQVDAVINIKGSIFAVKSYLVNDEMFHRIQKEGAIKKHVIEVIIYIWLLEVDGGCLIYESENQDVCTFRVEPYQPIINSVAKKCMELCDFKLKGKIPNRPYKSESKECNECEYCNFCWEKNNKGVKE